MIAEKRRPAHVRTSLFFEGSGRLRADDREVDIRVGDVVDVVGEDVRNHVGDSFDDFAFGEAGLGPSAVIWVFVVSTILSVHATFSINTLTHGIKPGFFNHRRFDTPDTTTNAWWLAIPTMGAAWHNNHHKFMSSARAGIMWWEVDLAWLILRLLAVFGIVWDLKGVPIAAVDENS